MTMSSLFGIRSSARPHTRCLARTIARVPMPQQRSGSSGAGKGDASVLADHYDRADVHERVLHHSERAAQLALSAHDLTRALALVDRARAHADSGELGGGLDAIEAEIWHLRGDAGSTTAIGERALARLPQGKRAWFRTACVVITSAGNQGDHECVARWADLAVEPRRTRMHAASR